MFYANVCVKSWANAGWYRIIACAQARSLLAEKHLIVRCMKSTTMMTRGLAFAILLLFSIGVFAQNFPITGKITGADGQPLAGVTVKVKGSNLAAQTNADGSFQINVPSQNSVLVVSYVGFTEQQVQVGNKNQISVAMTPLQNALENVVVVGYGTQKKRSVTGALATFNAEQLDERPVARVDQALVGQMAGVTVKQTSGTPGKGFSIQVRGTGSISAGSEPLYVIDGFPLATAAPNGSGNFGEGNPLDNINPNDIESIQVLKDASAAAIYGSRAANGVVLITTKKGKSGKARLNYNTYIGYNEPNRKLDVLSGEEWVERAIEYINYNWINSGPDRTANQTTEERRQILGLPANTYNTNLMIDDRWLQPGHPGLNYIDWQDAAFRKGFIQNHQLSATGGTDFVKYYISGNYSDQKGFVIGQGYKAFSGRANVEVTANKKLKFGLNIAPTYSITDDPGVEGKDNILHQLATLTPVQEDTMGLEVNAGKNDRYLWAGSANSPISKLKERIGQTKRFRTLATVFGDYQIMKGLSFRTTLNLDNTDNNSRSYYPYTIAGDLNSRQTKPGFNTYGSFSNYRKQTFVNENTLTYNTTVGDVHDLTLLAGASYNSDKFEYANMSSQGGYSSSVITTLNAAADIRGTSSETKNVLVSYFGRVQYDYDNKYLLQATLRRDGSSRFGQNTKWGMFPSLSVGYMLSEENFIKDIPTISNLKLRASWGKSGNYNIGDYSAIPTLGFYNYTSNSELAVGQAPNRIANPDLTWEKSETVNIGVDFGILRNRITGAFDYYTRNSTDLLLNVPVPQATGFSTALTNIGKVNNKGWELELTSRNTVGKFQWTSTVNFTHNSNKVLELGRGQTQILIPSSFDISHSILKVGEPMYSINVLRQIGILTADDIAKDVPIMKNQEEGDPRYLDANGDGVIDADDRVIVGKPNPDYTWGVTNTFRYKGFDLNFLVQGQWGGSIYSLFGRAIDRTGMGLENTLGLARDRWRSADDPGAGLRGKVNSKFGRIKNTDWLYPSDYWRVRNITLGYDLGSVMSKKIMQGARIYVTAENFFGGDQYKGGWNPEAANTNLSGNAFFPEAGDYGGLPLPKSLIVGLNLTF